LEDDFRRELGLKIFRFDPMRNGHYDLIVETTRFIEDDVVARSSSRPPRLALSDRSGEGISLC